MANPSAQTRVDPSTNNEIPLFDGFPDATIAHQGDTDFAVWEVEVTPPPYDIGDAIDITTQFNSTYTTKALQTLIDIGELSCTCSYDPVAYSQFATLVSGQGNKGQSITITFPDGSTGSFWGGIKSFTPTNMARGSQPRANVVFIVTNWDDTTEAEVGPAWSETSGT